MLAEGDATHHHRDTSLPIPNPELVAQLRPLADHQKPDVLVTDVEDAGGPGDPEPEFDADVAGAGFSVSLSPCLAPTARTRHVTSRKSLRRIQRLMG